MSPGYFDLLHTVAADEIDAQQHVHNLRYLQWTLWAAGEHTKTLGWDEGQQLENGVGWVVREHQIEFRVAALAGDEITVRTWVHDLQSFASRRKFVICRPADQTVLARGMTRWVYVDLRKHRVLRIPAEVGNQLTVLEQNAPLPWD